MTVLEIVKKYLDENWYDGLVGDGCGCASSNIGLCRDSGCLKCAPAYAHTITQEDIDSGLIKGEPVSFDPSDFEIGDTVYIEANKPAGPRPEG